MDDPVNITTTTQKLTVDTTAEPVVIETTAEPVELVLSDVGIQGPPGVATVDAPLVLDTDLHHLSLSTDGNLETVAGSLKVTDDLTAIDSITFDQLAAEASAVGKLAWNDTDGTLNLGLKGGNVTLQIGQEQVIHVKADDNGGLVEGKVVYQTGSDGANITVAYAQADSETASAQVLGVMTESATGGAKAFCTTFGLVRDLDTSALTEGAAIWLSPTVPGGMTTTKPANGYHLVLIGYCLRSHANNGVIFVKVANGYELDELHDVDINAGTLVSGQVLTYNGSLWVNSAPAGDITEITVSSPITGGGTSGSVAIGFDQSAQNTTNDTRYARLGAANAFTVGGHTITAESATVNPLVLKGASGQSASFFEVLANAGNTLFRINATGYGVTPLGFISGGTTMPTNARSAFYTVGASNIGVVVRGAASQSANLTEWQDSAGAVKAAVSPSGHIYTVDRLTVGNTNTSSLAYLTAYTNASTVGLAVRGAASQTANLQEWQNSSGTVLAFASSGGKLLGTVLEVTNGWVSLQTQNSGGAIQVTKATAQVASPGAGKAALYFRDGTNAGTLKLVVRAGAAGAETTILDNIPQ